MRAAVVWREQLHVLVVLAAVRLVPDAVVREVHLAIEVREVVLACPLADLVFAAVRSSVAVCSASVVRLEELLVLPLEVLLEDDALQLEIRILVSEAGLLLTAGATDAGVEYLLGPAFALQGMRAEQIASTGCERQAAFVPAKVDSLDETFVAEVADGVVVCVEVRRRRPPVRTARAGWVAPMSDVTVFVRTAGAPAALAGDLRQLLRTFGPDISAFNIRTMDEIVATALATPRFNSAVMAWFGAAGLLFTAAGLYSLLSFLVALRTRELAVRLAVGATSEHVLLLVVSRGLKLAAIGAAIGVGAGWLGESVLRSALPESPPSDLSTFLLPAGSVLVVA